ncbi:hypothetical protein EGR_04909 [Echinococcus granulosus]|uniref:Uncharacterized protein n=1 Tax=Echinococcus granulosus TaxID=6210 RepID=W6V2M3_ECHGR|nr:hypothetical protein EGR_04909 [Echinococcus granulosus]EUB60199.1 hypothetical protein EGR_04909 [Echinococcus granulosus]
MSRAFLNKLVFLVSECGLRFARVRRMDECVCGCHKYVNSLRLISGNPTPSSPFHHKSENIPLHFPLLKISALVFFFFSSSSSSPFRLPYLSPFGCVLPSGASTSPSPLAHRLENACTIEVGMSATL